jgi:hypothetical protein
MNLESDLRRAFKRKPAPFDFAIRVLARLEQRDVPPATHVSPSPRLGVVRWLAAAAAMTLVAIGGAQYYMHQQTLAHQQTVAEAERVKKEVRLALQIAGEKLALVQRKLQEPTR